MSYFKVYYTAYDVSGKKLADSSIEVFASDRSDAQDKAINLVQKMVRDAWTVFCN